MPLPIGIDARLVSLYWSSGKSSPGASPGKFSPVGAPNPNARRAASKRSLPNMRAVRIVPTFDDSRTMSRMDIGDHRHAAALGLGARDFLGEHPLDLELHRPVDGEQEVGAALGGTHPPLAVGDLPTFRVLLHPHATRAARERPLVTSLQPAETTVVDPDPADQWSRKRIGRVIALRLGDETDSAQPEGADLRRDRRLDLACDVHERMVTIAQLIAERALVHAHERRETGRDHRRLLDLTRIRIDAGTTDRDREIVAVPVEDAPALGGERHRVRALVESECRVMATIARLQVDETDTDQCEDRDHDDEQRPKAPGRAGSQAAREVPRARCRARMRTVACTRRDMRASARRPSTDRRAGRRLRADPRAHGTANDFLTSCAPSRVGVVACGSGTAPLGTCTAVGGWFGRVKPSSFAFGTTRFGEVWPSCSRRTC